MMRSGAISVRIGMLPEMNTTEPYSPRPRANESANPVSAAGTMAGSRTRRKVCQRDAEHRGRLLQVRVGSSSTGCTVRITNGRPMKVSADRHAERGECHRIPRARATARSSRSERRPR